LQLQKRSQNFIRAHNGTLSVEDAVIRVYDAAGNMIETYEHKGRTMREPDSKFS
jgi:hypothetical protein